MRIVHCAPFAPAGCGMYEAARDMVVADILSGHETYIVDTGTTTAQGGIYTPGAPGKVDERGESKIVSASPDVLWQADIIIAHTGMQDNWISPCQAPIIWILHGRPRACFSPEYGGAGHSYSMLANLAKWPRIKKMVTFWPYHVKFWEPIMPLGKLECLPAPPIDGKRFSREGIKHDYTAMGGRINVMICESWREDIDTYEIAHGAIELSRSMRDVKFHFYAMETPLKCWDYLIAELRRLGTLGEIWARRNNIEEVYRAADIVLSPQRIVTRSVGEALCCGTPVVAATGCEYATYTAHPDEPEEVAEALKTAINDLFTDRMGVQFRVDLAARAFSLTKYSEYMNELYKKLV
jgi:hypothetical protein